jgi:glycolate oxidase FAD binding subunit
MPESLRPTDPGNLAEAVTWAVSNEQPLEVVGGGSKREMGRPVQSAATLELSAFDGIIDYQASELVLTAHAATPLATIEAAVASERQMLAFEPANYGRLFGAEEGATLGGVLACNLSGPRRIKAGAARDHFLGAHAVSGRGERFKAGGRVVKNVTGYDLCKLLAGSYGTLAVMHEVTVKVLPAPERTRTVLVFGLDDAAALDALGAALSSPFDVSGAAHLSAASAARSGVSYVSGAGAAVTAVRVEGFATSVEARCASLREIFGRFGTVEELHSKNSAALWREVRDVEAFAGESTPLWRLSVPPASGAAVAARIADRVAGRTLFDWGGGLIWLAVDEAPDAGEVVIRGAIADVGGHATLVRADPQTRAALSVFQPQPDGIAALTARVKRGFDPVGVLNPGRMYAGM